jgi:altronate hydrolase
MNMNMNFNRGGIIAGEPSLAKANKQLSELMLATASGWRSSGNAHGLGDDAFLPWQIGRAT